MALRRIFLGEIRIWCGDLEAERLIALAQARRALGLTSSPETGSPDEMTVDSSALPRIQQLRLQLETAVLDEAALARIAVELSTKPFPTNEALEARKAVLRLQPANGALRAFHEREVTRLAGHLPRAMQEGFYRFHSVPQITLSSSLSG